jgi:hypothetical protein
MHVHKCFIVATTIVASAILLAAHSRLCFALRLLQLQQGQSDGAFYSTAAEADGLDSGTAQRPFAGSGWGDANPAGYSSIHPQQDTAPLQTAPLTGEGPSLTAYTGPADMLHKLGGGGEPGPYPLLAKKAEIMGDVISARNPQPLPAQVRRSVQVRVAGVSASTFPLL